MNIQIGQINIWAVLVAGIATFMLGGVWYMALFGKLWQRLNGYSDDKVKQMQAARPPAVFFGTMIVSYVWLAVVVAMLAIAIDIRSAGSGAMLGFLLWLGPALVIAATSYIAYDKPLGVYLIDAAYQLCFLVMTGAILGGWR